MADLREEMLENLSMLQDENVPYDIKLDCYDYLMDGCEDIVDEMIEAYRNNGTSDVAKMLLEILSNYPGHDEVYFALVSWLYRGDDVPLFAHLIGKYGDDRGLEALQGFLKEYEPTYSEFIEIRAAIEELGGEVSDDDTPDFSEDPLYKATIYDESEETDEDIGKRILDRLTNPDNIDDAGNGEQDDNR